MTLWTDIFRKHRIFNSELEKLENFSTLLINIDKHILTAKKRMKPNFSAAASSKMVSQRLHNVRMVQNFHLVWLGESIQETNNYYRSSILKFREVVKMVNIFINVDECIDFITDIGEKVFVVISEEISEIVIAILQDISQVHSVYIYLKNYVPFERGTRTCSKMSAVHTDIVSICEALKMATQECDHNLISISYIEKTDGSANQNLDTLDPSFMYTEILKEILLTIEFKEAHFKEFITYCHEQSEKGVLDIHTVDMIEEEYHRHKPIWWYTSSSFLYSMLNRALRTMEADLIAKMGFFVRDLHNQISRLHTEQYGSKNHSESFTVYRGQGLSYIDFNQLKKIQGGLLSFNNFLSTSLARAVSFAFAESNQYNPDLISVLFEINVNPSISSTPFANVQYVSSFQAEKEILFSMHSIFRIGEVKQIEKNNNRLWQVTLTLTDDHDSQLQEVMKCMREETDGPTGWFRLGLLMMKLAEFDKAEQVFDMIVDQTTYEKEQDRIYHYLGWIKHDQGKYTEALTYHEKSLKLFEKALPANYWGLASSNNSIGEVYGNMGKHSKALSYYRKTLEILKQNLLSTHPNLASLYNNIGGTYANIGEYSKALSCYEKALEIFQKTLSANHPTLASFYNNIGEVSRNMGEYSRANLYYERALEIFQKTLPTNHPLLATSYNNIGAMYYNVGDHSKAILHYEKVLEIQQKTLPGDHPDLGKSYLNIGLVYDNMGDYSNALSYCEKGLVILQKTLPANHASLAASYNNIGRVYHNMGEYLKAVSYYEKLLEINQKILSPNHPDWAVSYNNIGTMYRDMGECSKALSYYEKALEFQKNLSANHPSLAISYDNIGEVYDKMGEHSRALSYFKQALDIRGKTLAANHPGCAISYIHMGAVYDKMNEYSSALSYYGKALDIFQKTLPAIHPNLAVSWNNIGKVYHHMGEDSKALSYYERALEIYHKTLPENHPFLATSYNNIGEVYTNVSEYSKALSYYEKGLEIRRKTLPDNHPDLGISYDSIGRIYDSMGEFSKALSYFECALNIWQRSLLSDHRHLKNVKESIEMVREKCK